MTRAEVDTLRKRATDTGACIRLPVAQHRIAVSKIVETYLDAVWELWAKHIPGDRAAYDRSRELVVSAMPASTADARREHARRLLDVMGPKSETTRSNETSPPDGEH